MCQNPRPTVPGRVRIMEELRKPNGLFIQPETGTFMKNLKLRLITENSDFIINIGICKICFSKINVE